MPQNVIHLIVKTLNAHKREFASIIFSKSERKNRMFY